ncbi:MAG TPA: ABC transporter permease [Bryobacteraceae bacterium]|nr:ABC transporter permease [Bryobacteraceae bacterium]
MLRRVYSFLLHLYPSHYREEFGGEMQQLFLDRCRAEGTLRVCYETLPDLAVTACKEHMDTLRRDLLYSLRAIARNPGFATVVLLTLALGIGANTAVFSVVKGVLLDPFPYKDPERLVQLYEKRPKQGRVRNVVSAPDFGDWKSRNTVFEDMAALTGAAFAVNTAEGSQIVQAARVTSNFFHMLGVKPVLGRDFLPEEETAGKDRVLILSHGAWQHRFGGDRSIVGRRLTLGGAPFEVVGVLPAITHVIGAEVEMWQPLVLDTRTGRGGHFLNVYARLKPGVTTAQARSEMDVISAQLERQYPDENTGHGANLFSLSDEVTDKVRPALTVLLGAVGLLLLIACANVANLFIARIAHHQREISIRTALGAGAGRLIRQIITETVLLSVAGGAVGVLLAHWGVRALVAANPGNLPRLANIAIDTDVLLFTSAVSVGAGLLFGLLPALHATRARVADTLKQSSRNSTARGMSRRLLVVVEVALALILLVGSGLMLRSFTRLAAVNPGFDAARVLTFDVPLMGPRYAKPESKRAFLLEASTRIAQLPGVASVAGVNALPLSGRDSGTNFVIEGRPAAGYSMLPNGRYRVVTPGYFETLRIPLRAGRFPAASDNDSSPYVLVINETMARQYWHGEDPIGKRIALSREQDKPRQIVGIVSDVKHYALDGETRPEMYFPYAQEPQSSMTMVLRTTQDPENLIAAVRREIMRIDKDQPVAKVRTYEQILSTSVAQPRLYSTLLTIFSTIALLLAAVGIYGVMSFAVGQRTQEMGLRMALGAGAGSVQTLVLKEGIVLASLGIGAGLLGAFLLTGAIEAILFETEATDPATFVASALLLIVIATTACFIPARRATRVDPIIALRGE